MDRKTFSKTKKIPKKLQGVLWSADVSHLDVQKDKGYIIHQIFSYGRLEDILWLFKIYPKEEIVKVFTAFPYKNYEAARFHFVKEHLLKLKGKNIDERYYVKNTPRNLR